MLSKAEIESYREQGYLIPDYRLPVPVLEEIRSAHVRLIDQHPQFEDYCPALLAFDTGFLNFARIPEILDMVAQLIGDDLALWNSSLFAKPAGKGRRVPWHQDGEYWPIRPLATCSVWLAIDDATVDNGCLEVIPGSHRGGNLLDHEMNSSPDLSLPLQLKADQFDASRAVPITLEAGQVSFHDVFLVHGSAPNRSDSPRRGMTLRYMPTSSVYVRDQAGRRDQGRLSMAERTLYLMRGRDLSGQNDFRVRF